MDKQHKPEQSGCNNNLRSVRRSTLSGSCDIGLFNCVGTRYALMRALKPDGRLTSGMLTSSMLTSSMLTLLSCTIDEQILLTECFP